MSRRPSRVAKATPCAQCGLSRRQLIAGSAALAIPPGSPTPSGPDPVIHECEAWIRLDTEYEDLILRWQQLETHLVRNYNWFRLSDAEQQLVPAASEFSEIEARLGPMAEARWEGLARLPDMPAASLQGVLLKLTIAAKSVPADENPDAHALLESTLADLEAVIEPGTRRRA